MRCIWCQQDFPEEEIEKHIAEKHIGIHFTEGAKPTDIDPQQETPKEKQNQNVEGIEKRKKVEKVENKENKHTPPLPLENPKKHYLNAQEILNLIGNTNMQFPRKDNTGTQ